MNATTRQTPHVIDNSLIGRAWVASDDIALVLGFTAAGMVRVQRGDGRVQQISPDIVREALASTGIYVDNPEEMIETRARAAEADAEFARELAADPELAAMLARARD